MRYIAIVITLLGCCIPSFAKEKSAQAYLSELFALIDRADEIIVYSDGFKRESVLYKSSDRRDLNALKQAITLKPHGGPGMCACIDQPEIALLKKGKEIAAVWNHEGSAIGSSVWGGEWESRDPERWLHWFDQRGMKQAARLMYGVDAAIIKQGELDEKRWEKAMPGSLRPLWTKAREQVGPPPDKLNLKPLNEALAKQYPDQQERLRPLFAWFGSGAGPWSGYPLYEEIAERLLLQYSTADLISAATTRPLTDVQTEGAARTFANWYFQRDRPKDSRLIPNDLKRKLYERSLKGSDPDKIERAMKAFKE